MRIIAWLLTIIFLSSTGIAQSNSLKLEVTLKHMETEAAYKELTAMFPKVPVGFPKEVTMKNPHTNIFWSATWNTRRSRNYSVSCGQSR